MIGAKIKLAIAAAAMLGAGTIGWTARDWQCDAAAAKVELAIEQGRTRRAEFQLEVQKEISTLAFEYYAKLTNDRADLERVVAEYEQERRKLAAEKPGAIARCRIDAGDLRHRERLRAQAKRRPGR